MEFAGVLREWRTRRRVSQLELALRAGTTQRHVSFLERNALLLAAGYAPAYPQTALNELARR